MATLFPTPSAAEQRERVAKMAARDRQEALIRRARRAALEDTITRAIALLDADDWDADLEDETLEEEDGEATAQAVTLCPNVVPLRRVAVRS